MNLDGRRLDGRLRCSASQRRQIAHHRPRRLKRHAVFLDADDAIDGRAGARGRRIGARTRIGDRLSQRSALEPGAIADVEPDPGNRGRATSCRGVDDGADAIDLLGPSLSRPSLSSS